ncbi:hypothetical protein AUJ61_02445 [Candidatus Pacearchaeota archaeon CG1_02_30_18]|nr:MAG: hypothetical protein AUJ61_02445 [Candidatus Pacearchaeota archaeon CG1_02_30_18]PIN71417.1 MAG: hypothetical protein COV77_02165 [Candidatus Pacearchaeota archaeon CG11_big_fil_rev_8_21_14_0_20_30_13]PJA71233.1 MAG: hypothetical protein CO153_02585 [Candidatus Pacearchaeota archaeon CG_4_9_14_3_um_filter_30_11]
MTLEVLLKGFLVGFTAALPFGPLGILCIKKSLIPKNLGGYFTGFGAACVDALFALVAGFGITIISKFLINNESSIKGIGGLFLIFLGLKELKTKVPREIKTQNERKDFLKEFFSGFSLAIANPFVIFSFLALYTILGLGKIAGDYGLSALLVLSTFLGSFLGLAFLNWIVIHKKHKIKEGLLNKINKILGGILTGTGIYLILQNLVSF